MRSLRWDGCLGTSYSYCSLLSEPQPTWRGRSEAPCSTLISPATPLSKYRTYWYILWLSVLEGSPSRSLLTSTALKLLLLALQSLCIFDDLYSCSSKTMFKRCRRWGMLEGVCGLCRVLECQLGLQGSCILTPDPDRLANRRSSPTTIQLPNYTRHMIQLL